MYRCTECKEEFIEKPDYCTCGNDEFEEFSPIPQTPSKTQGKNSQSNTNTVQKHIDAGKIFSIGFFFICIILAIIPWLIKGEKVEKTPAATLQEHNKNVPGIEKFWQDAHIEIQDSSKEIVQNPIAEKVENAPKPVEKIKSEEILPKTNSKSPNAENKTKTNPPASAKNASKTSQKPAEKQKSTQKPDTNPAQPINLPQSVLNQQNKTSNTSSDTKAQTRREAQNSTPVEPQTPAQVEEKPQMDKNEFLNYKGSIRSALLSKLNITAIQGSGDCAVEFSIDNSGKLINRNFIYKSTNKTVNDEVYFMLMRLPYYKQPPAHYRGEKIKLKFSFDNGYYEISFI